MSTLVRVVIVWLTVSPFLAVTVGNIIRGG